MRSAVPRLGAALTACAVLASVVSAGLTAQAPSASHTAWSSNSATVRLVAQVVPDVGFVSAGPGGDVGGGGDGGQSDPGQQVAGGPARHESSNSGNSGSGGTAPTQAAGGPERPAPSSPNGSPADAPKTGGVPQKPGEPTTPAAGQRPDEPAKAAVPNGPGEPTKAAVPQRPDEPAHGAVPRPDEPGNVAGPTRPGEPTNAAVPPKPGVPATEGAQPTPLPGAPAVPEAAQRGEGMAGADGCVPGTPGCGPKPLPPPQDGGGCTDSVKGCNSGAAADDGFGWDDAGHLALDGISFFPGANIPAASINAAWYGAEGNELEAGIAAAGIVPFGKWVTTGGKLIGKGYTAIKDLRMGEEAVEDGVKAADEIPGAGGAGSGSGEPPNAPVGPKQNSAGQATAPPGVPSDWQSRPARGDGTVWQKPGSGRDADSVRVMNPGADPRYPNGYARFYNKHNQAIDLQGKPGGQDRTHIPRRSDGTFDVPAGW